jgi:hypothetical protein
MRLPLSHAGRHAGQDEMKRLTQSTVAALYDADLSDEVALLESRVFSRMADELFEAERDRGRYAWRFKPMVELLLLHIHDVARQHRRSLDERRSEIHWAFEACGF